MSKPILKKTTLIIPIFLALVFYSLLFLNLRTASPLPEGEPALIIEDQILLNNSFVIENNHALISYNVIKEYLDPYIFWDTTENQVTITTYDKTVRLATESLTAMINTKPVDISFPVKVISEPYVPIRLLEELYGIKVNVLKDKDRVIVDKNLSEREIAVVMGEGVKMKLSPSWLSPTVTKLNKGDELFVYGNEKRWHKARTADGLLGFIPEKNLEVRKVRASTEKEPVNHNRHSQGKLNMVWDYIHSITPDKSGKTPPKGLDIVSPTWFSITDGKGTIRSKADISYTEWAHKNNLVVWALIDNSFDPDITHEFLSSSETRDEIIRKILMYADLFRLDGINIDFENVYLKDKELLVQFMRELTPVLREAGITVSMDVTTKSTSENWSLFYDRKELGKVIDYVILMAYDEHWATSPVSGSVASINWVEQGIISLLEDVPPEKVLLALPFYTREWKETPQEDGSLAVKSRAISMGQAKRIIEKNNAAVIWDENTGQHFTHYSKDDSVYKIWLEDEESIKLKANLVNKYGLAGASAWRKDFEEPEIWEVLYECLKQHSK